MGDPKLALPSVGEVVGDVEVGVGFFGVAPHSPPHDGNAESKLGSSSDFLGASASSDGRSGAALGLGTGGPQGSTSSSGGEERDMRGGWGDLAFGAGVHGAAQGSSMGGYDLFGW